MPNHSPAVRFVATPFLPEHQPALGISSLVAVLEARGIEADIKYLNIEYGRRIGWPLYTYLSNQLPTEFLLGEFVFAPALWGDAAPKWEDYVARFMAWQRLNILRRREGDLDARLQEAQTLYDGSAAAVRGWADEILRDRPRVVGFTSTFQQNVASLALARELRRRVPREELLIVFGGANCEDDMGRALADNFPFIDHVVSGEAENVIVDVIEAVCEESGRRVRAGSALPRYVVGTMIKEMDALPLPNFDHYFAAIKETEWDEHANLAAESSRGCWWGAKSHCTFCGLNGTTMAFRSKRPDKFAEELRVLSKKYGRNFFMLTDNILDFGYINTLFPDLISQGDDVKLFYEVKSNLNKEQLEILAAGNVVRLQPGIESLSTPILKLMAKGTTRLQNVQLLKWCEEFRIGLAWNLLYGFPGERPEEYDAMAGLMPDLCHLPPPTGSGKIRLDRFGPYWKSPAKYGILNMRHFWTYDFAYPALPAAERERIAYFFDYDYADARNPDEYAGPTLDAADFWRESYARKATLEVKPDEDGGHYVLDTRARGRDETTPLTPDARRLLKTFDSYKSRKKFLSEAQTGEPGVYSGTAEDLSALLDEMLERRWLVEEDGKLLSIVLDRSESERIVNRRVRLQLEFFGIADVLAAGTDSGEGLGVLT